jgi:hypothetical protein
VEDIKDIKAVAFLKKAPQKTFDLESRVVKPARAKTNKKSFAELFFRKATDFFTYCQYPVRGLAVCHGTV